MHALFSFLITLNSLALPTPDVWIWPRAYRTINARVGDRSVFVLQRHFDRQGGVSARGPSAWPWKVRDLTLVFRLESRPQVDRIVKEFLNLKSQWESRGVHVAGLQLDYDSPTAKLGVYRDDLKQISSKLKNTQLSVTGLTDWLTLDHFDFSKDVIVYFQLYLGSRAHDELEQNLSHLKRARFPFKLGLLPGQTLPARETAKLERNPNFQGFAEFFGGPL